MKQIMIDAWPMNQDGETIYIETDLRNKKNQIAEARMDRTLGVVNVANVQTATNVVNTASSLVPNKPITYQSDFSKVANVVAVGASAVATVGIVFPPVAIIAGLVAGAAALLGKVFANSKAKKFAAEAGEYETVNAQIKYENYEIDKQYDVAYKAISEMRNALSSLSGLPDGNGLGSLGLCLWNCKDQKQALASAKAEYEVLVKEQENKTKIMASLLDEYNKLMKAFLTLRETKSANDWLMWIFLGSAAVIGGVLVLQNKKKINKKSQVA